MSETQRRPKEHLNALGLHPKHHFGQNFLADEGLAQRIALLATPHEGIGVAEIGAGLGALTGPLLKRARRVVAIERDRDLIQPLTERFSDSIASGRLVVVPADAKVVDFFEHFAEPRADVVVAGNLPYQITGPLLQKLCGVASRVLRVVLLVQLEVANRLTAAPGTSAYGGLSVFVQAKYITTRQFIVRRGAFYPQPNVDSAVVVLEPKSPPVAEETPIFTELVHRAFQQRRKQLRNAWRGVAGKSMTELEVAAAAARIDLAERGECLSVERFRDMALELENR